MTSTFDGYLMPNPTYTYIIWKWNRMFVVLFQNDEELISLHRVKWYQVFLSNSNNST